MGDHMKQRLLCPMAALALLWVLAGPRVLAAPRQVAPGAWWELRMLGVTNFRKLAAAASLPRRPVALAIVGQGGVSRSLLEPVLSRGNAFEYRAGAADPRSETHDTSAARVILDLTSALGVRVRLLVWQPGDDWADVADAMDQAGREADIVAFFQSFWSGDMVKIADAIRRADRCLFISPYAEYEGRPTCTCVQAYSAKPWSLGLPHFVTVAPVARSAPGEIIQPASGAADAEVINFLAPSYYASGPGGTCPAAEVASAMAAYIMSAAARKPPPVEVVRIMRETSAIDEDALTTAQEYNFTSVRKAALRIRALVSPEPGKPRKLDAAGVLNLWRAYLRLTMK
jgi:hypothetical protein